MQQETQPSQHPTNSQPWWDEYFRAQWEANRGRQQTRHFMDRLLASLPEPELAYLSSRPAEVLDWGCALGEGVVALAERFPGARVSGLDFSATAIDDARQHYPDHEFLLTAGGEIPRPFDVIFTSNCLEHFERPLEVMAEHLRSCRELYVALVPYNEFPLSEFHRSQFREESFPRRVGGFVRLAAKAIDVDPSHWNGQQLLVVYGSESYVRGRNVTDTRELERDKWDRYYATAPLPEEDADTRAFGEELTERLTRVLAPGSRVLEAGCGAGWQGLALARSGRFRVSMMDFSEQALSHARRLFSREGVAADFIEADAFSAGDPEYDLVFNAGVLEHYTFDEQVALLRGMASRSQRYVLVLVPNRLCYWYWLWRVQQASRGAWPFGKEVPLGDLSKLFEAAGLHFVGQAFMGVRWTEGFVRAMWGMDQSLLQHVLEVHRWPLVPDAEKAYLVAGLGSVSPEPRGAPGWSPAPFAEERPLAESTAALSDALSLRIAADVELVQLRAKAAEHATLPARLAEAAEARRGAEEALRQREADSESLRSELSRQEAAARELQERLDAAQAELRATQQKREALRAALEAEQHARQLLESSISGSYDQIVERVREVVASVTHPGATVAVVSKGDAQLLKLEGRRGWHFPRGDDGQYAGHYPEKGADAIDHLEALRDDGAEFLVFPNASFWWLDHYRDFRDHLDAHYARVWRDERCVVYKLGGEEGPASDPRGEGFWTRVGKLLPGKRPANGNGRTAQEAAGPGGRGGNGAAAAAARGGTAAVLAPAAQAAAARQAERLATSQPAAPRAAGAYDVVCLPIIDWDFRYQRPQHLAAQFAAAGHRVFYVSQEFRPEGEPYVLKERRKNVFEVSLRGPRQNVYTQVLTEQAAAVLMESLDALCRGLFVDAAVSVVQLPFWWPLARAARRRNAWPVVYDCMDHHAGFSTNRGAMLEQEDDLLAGADLVVAASAGIERDVRRRSRDVVLVRNGCEYDHFAAPQQQQPPPFAKKAGRPVVGYYGAIADWFDADLVADLAARRPDWDFVLVGSTFTADTARLSGLANVSMPGEKPYAEIPRWLGGFDVALLPFKRVPLTEATNPVKAYEILAAGKPLVSVPLPEVAALGDLVRLASDAAEFERQVSAALAERDPRVVEKRKAFARDNTWEKRFEQLAPAVRSVVRRYAGAGGRALEVPGLVSVILPVYNQANLLRDSIESVLAQTYPDFELVVLNDGSKDDVASVLAEYAGHPKVRVLTQPNQKLPKALSNAFEFARGEFWTWTSADNLMGPEQLSRMVAFLRSRPDVGMVYADYLAIDDRGQPLRDPTFRPHNRRSPESSEIHLPRTTAQLNTVQDNFIGACFMYTAAAGRVLGEYDAYTMGVEDYDYWMRINTLLGIEHLGTDEVLYQYRVHDNTLNARAAELKIFDRVFEVMEYEKRRHAFYGRPWTIYADPATAVWLRPAAGGNTVIEWGGGAVPAAGDGDADADAKVMFLVRGDVLPDLAAAGAPEGAYVAAWFDAKRGSWAPYLHRTEIASLVDVAFAADAVTADRLDLFAPKVLQAAPGAGLLKLAVAAANNDVYYRRTRDPAVCRRDLPEPFCPPGRRLRVLLQVDDFTQGGLENVVIDLAASLDPAAFEVALLVLGRQGPAAEAARRAGVEVIALPGGDRTREYRRLLADRRFDLVNAHYSLFGAAEAADLDVPFVQTIHNTYVWLSREQVAAHRAADPFTAAYVCVSGNVAFYSDLKVGLPPAKTVVVPNGVDLGRLDAADAPSERRRLRREFGLADDDFVFLNIASLHPPKSQRELVRALARVVETHPRAKVVLLGGTLDAKYADSVRREIESLGLSRSVLIPGHREDVASFYHAADAFVLPSYWEGWSLALTEAVYVGLPVVATDVGGARDLLTKTGGGQLVQPPFDCVIDLDAGTIARHLNAGHPEFIAELAAAMRRVCEKPVRPALTEELRRVLDRRSAYAAYGKLFQWLAGGGHPAAARCWLREPAGCKDPKHATPVAPPADEPAPASPAPAPAAPATPAPVSSAPPAPPPGNPMAAQARADLAERAVQTIPIDYPVTPRARYGYGKPSHAGLRGIIERNRAAYEATLRGFLPFADRFAAIPAAADTARPAEPHWVNGYFPPLDAISLYGLIATRRPALYLEIGSGNSTKFAARAVRDFGLPTKIVSIDPHPRAEVNDLCDRIVRRPLEDADLDEFDRLAPGDVLLFDGSHRCFPNSDVTVFFLEVLPRLRPGVLVAVHDIFLPNDYPPPVFIEQFYSEQYLLAAWLLAEGTKIDVVLPVAFVQGDAALLPVVAPLFRDGPLSVVDRNGALFWLETK